jgi:hypothetical protein
MEPSLNIYLLPNFLFICTLDFGPGAFSFFLSVGEGHSPSVSDTMDRCHFDPTGFCIRFYCFLFNTPLVTFSISYTF